MNATRTVFPAAPLLGLALAAQALLPASAQELSGGVAGDWLSRYTGAGTAGVGGAFVATANTPFGMLWNPAGIARMYQNEVHFEMSQLFEGTQFHSVGFAMPSQSLPSFGLAVLSLRSGDFERTNDLNEAQGSFNEGEMAFVLSASKNFSRRLSLGTNVKVVRQSIAEFDAAGFGADFGVMFDVADGLRLGASLLNLAGPSLKLREVAEKYPLEVRGGGAWRFLDGRGLVSMEIDHRKGPGVALRGGTEFWVHPTMALRMGYDGGSPAGGMSYRVSPNMQLDYGLADHELGVTHKIGIAYRFGGFFASSKADPAVFSPLGEKAVTKFVLEAHAKSAIEKWSLDIVDKQDQVVRRFSGREEPPSHVMWDGKDESGAPLPDGEYNYRLVVVDGEGGEIADHERVVEITTGGPSGNVPVHLE